MEPAAPSGKSVAGGSSSSSSVPQGSPPKSLGLNLQKKNVENGRFASSSSTEEDEGGESSPEKPIDREETEEEHRAISKSRKVFTEPRIEDGF